MQVMEHRKSSTLKNEATRDGKAQGILRQGIPSARQLEFV